MQAPSLDDARRWGWFEAPAEPPTRRRLAVDPSWSAPRLSLAILRAAWPWVLPGSLLLVAHNVATTLVPLVLGRTVDTVVTPAADGTPIEHLVIPMVVAAISLAALYVVANVGFRLGGRLGWFGVQRCLYELSTAVIDRITDQRGFAGPARPSGALLSIATGDVQRACGVLYLAIYPLGNAFGLIATIVILLQIHVWLGVGVAIGLPLIVVLVQLSAGPLQRRSAVEQAELADASAGATDLVRGYRSIAGLHAQDTAAARYRTLSRRALGATIAARRAGSLVDAVSLVIAQCAAAAIVAAAALLAITGDISAGALVTVAGLAIGLVSSLDSLTSDAASAWAVSQASSRRVLDLLGAAPHPAAQGAETASSAGALTIEQGRIDDTTLDVHVAPAEFVVASVPPRLRHGLTDVLTLRRVLDDGAAHLDGTPIASIDPWSLRERVLVMPHVPGIFTGTVRENVGLTPDGEHSTRLLGDDVIETALAVAQLSPDELPDGYDTLLGDEGWQLSGGQRQRIALARAVAADPAILVMFSPTSSVDALTESRIAEHLRRHRAGKATFVATPSNAFRAVADRIITIGGEER